MSSNINYNYGKGAGAGTGAGRNIINFSGGSDSNPPPPNTNFPIPPILPTPNPPPPTTNPPPPNPPPGTTTNTNYNYGVGAGAGTGASFNNINFGAGPNPPIERLLPHIILDMLDVSNQESTNRGEYEWKALVDDLSQRGQFNNCLAICDVSGSMGGINMKVCVALGLLFSELCEQPWKGKVITFSTDPKLLVIGGNSLIEKKAFIENMEWADKVDFQKVFDTILKFAVDEDLNPDKMIKRVFVFTDMDFDTASAANWNTFYQNIVNKFMKFGGFSVPQLVFWNLSGAISIPVTVNGVSPVPGAMLYGGYSDNIMKLFMQGDGVVSI